MIPTGLPDLSKPSRDLNSSSKPEFLNPMFLYKIEKCSRVLTAERRFSLGFLIKPGISYQPFLGPPGVRSGPGDYAHIEIAVAFFVVKWLFGHDFSGWRSYELELVTCFLVCILCLSIATMIRQISDRP